MDHVGRREVTPRVRTSGGRRDRRREEAEVIPTLKRREAFQKKDLRMWRQGFGMGGTKKGPRGWRLEGDGAGESPAAGVWGQTQRTDLPMLSRGCRGI